MYCIIINVLDYFIIVLIKLIKLFFILFFIGVNKGGGLGWDGFFLKEI